jgi:hypothetical protein
VSKYLLFCIFLVTVNGFISLLRHDIDLNSLAQSGGASTILIGAIPLGAKAASSLS